MKSVFSESVFSESIFSESVFSESGFSESIFLKVYCKYGSILGPNFIDLMVTQPKLFQTERTWWLAHLPSFCELVSEHFITFVTLQLLLRSINQSSCDVSENCHE